MPELVSVPPAASGIALSPKEEKLSGRYRQGGGILSKGNFEGGSFEDEFDDN